MDEGVVGVHITSVLERVGDRVLFVRQVWLASFGWLIANRFEPGLV